MNQPLVVIDAVGIDDDKKLRGNWIENGSIDHHRVTYFNIVVAAYTSPLSPLPVSFNEIVSN